jgi:LmbE family N-acetylglucosaminyl deacetylase
LLLLRNPLLQKVSTMFPRTECALVIASHPDDEVLGCGGTMAQLVHRGAEVHVAFLSDGVLSRDGDKNRRQDELAARRASAKKACDILGARTLTFGDFPDNRMDTVPHLDIAKFIEETLSRHPADTVLTHHAGDVNIDHRRTHEAVVTACRPQRGNPVKTLLCFEVPSSTEWQLPCSAPAFSPNWFMDITDTLERKLNSLDAYAVELRPWPHPRSRRAVEYLARWRGATIGTDAAEAFVLGRQIT